MPGFKLALRGLSIDHAAFGCCAATGNQLLRDEAGRELTLSCEIGLRMGSLRRLMRQGRAAVTARSTSAGWIDAAHARVLLGRSQD